MCYWCENVWVCSWGKSSFKMLGLTFFLNWIGAVTLSLLLKLPPRKLELFREKICSPEVALYLYKSTIRSCIEYCYHVWAGALYCFLKLSNKLQNRISRTVGLSLVVHYEPLAHYFGRCWSEMAELVPLPYSWWRSTCYSDRLHDFPVTISRCYKDVFVNSFFPRIAKLWNSL